MTSLAGALPPTFPICDRASARPIPALFRFSPPRHGKRSRFRINAVILNSHGRRIPSGVSLVSDPSSRCFFFHRTNDREITRNREPSIQVSRRRRRKKRKRSDTLQRPTAAASDFDVAHFSLQTHDKKKGRTVKPARQRGERAILNRRSSGAECSSI